MLPLTMRESFMDHVDQFHPFLFGLLTTCHDVNYYDYIDRASYNRNMYFCRACMIHANMAPYTIANIWRFEVTEDDPDYL